MFVIEADIHVGLCESVNGTETGVKLPSSFIICFIVQAQYWRIFMWMLKTGTEHVLNLDKLFLVLEKQNFNF